MDVVGAPVFAAVRPLSKSLSVSQGKGATAELAKVSALMEAIETFHAENLELDVINMSFEDWLNQKGQFKLNQFPLRRLQNLELRKNYSFTEAICIACNRSHHALIPTDLFDLDTTTSKGNSIFHGSSNGLASGNTTNEAVLHSLCEVIERHNLSCWIVAGLSDIKSRASNKLKLHTVEDVASAMLVEKILNEGLQVAVWHVSIDINIPTFYCLLIDNNASTPYPIRASGSGAHPIKEIALFRAISEAVQSRVTSISGARDDMFWENYRRDIVLNDGLEKSSMAALLRSNGQLAFDAISSVGARTEVPQLLQLVLSSLNQFGVEHVFYKSLSKSQLGVPVAYCFVPGLVSDIRRRSYLPGPRLHYYSDACDA